MIRAVRISPSSGGEVGDVAAWLAQALGVQVMEIR